MKLNNILSSDLPEIDNSIKECVNLGQWLLFKSHGLEKDPETVFYLKAGSKIFSLNQAGKVLETMDRDKLNVHIDELFYFSDIAHPQSLSNMKAA